MGVLKHPGYAPGAYQYVQHLGILFEWATMVQMFYTSLQQS